MFLGAPQCACSKNKKLTEKLHCICKAGLILCDFCVCVCFRYFWIYATIIVLTWFGTDDMQ